MNPGFTEISEIFLFRFGFRERLARAVDGLEGLSYGVILSQIFNIFFSRSNSFTDDRLAASVVGKKTTALQEDYEAQTISLLLL